MPVWGGGLLAVRAIELLQICSQLLQRKHRPQPKHGANEPCDILTYFGAPNKPSPKPDRASQENVKGGRPQGHVSSFVAPPNSGAIGTIFGTLLRKLLGLQLSLHSVVVILWKPLALHRSLAALLEFPSKIYTGGMIHHGSVVDRVLASCSIMQSPGHEPMSTT